MRPHAVNPGECRCLLCRRTLLVEALERAGRELARMSVEDADRRRLTLARNVQGK